MLHCIKEGKNNEYCYTRKAVNDFLKGPEFIENAKQAEVFNMINDPDGTVLSVNGEKKRSTQEIFRNASPAELLSLSLESAKLVMGWNKLAERYRKSVEFLSSMEYWDRDD